MCNVYLIDMYFAAGGAFLIYGFIKNKEFIFNSAVEKNKRVNDLLQNMVLCWPRLEKYNNRKTRTLIRPGSLITQKGI